MFIDAVKNDAVDGATGNFGFIGVHSAYSASGANELSGSPYAREVIAWDAATSRVADNTSEIVVDIPGGNTAAFLGFWSLLTSGVFQGMTPLGSTIMLPAVVFNTDDYVYCEGHGLNDADQVVFSTVDGGTIPGGLAEGTIYFVRDSATDRFKVSATSGGGAIDITTSGNTILQNIIPEVFGSDGTLTFGAGDIDLIAF